MDPWSRVTLSTVAEHSLATTETRDGGADRKLVEFGGR